MIGPTSIVLEAKCLLINVNQNLNYRNRQDLNTAHVLFLNKHPKVAF